MIVCTREEFISGLMPGDIGLIDGQSFFATLQDWYRKKFHEGEYSASHGFMFAEPPTIIESNGFHPSYGSIHKNVGGRTKCWVFRNKAMSMSKFKQMKAYADGAIEMGGHYGIGNIVQFGLKFIGIRKKIKDAQGQFCTEFTSNLIYESNVPYNVLKQFCEITPSLQLNYFMGRIAQLDGWYLALEYNGKEYSKYEVK